MISIMEFTWLSGSVGILSTKLPVGSLAAGATKMSHIDVKKTLSMSNRLRTMTKQPKTMPKRPMTASWCSSYRQSLTNVRQWFDSGSTMVRQRFDDGLTRFDDGLAQDDKVQKVRQGFLGLLSFPGLPVDQHRRQRFAPALVPGVRETRQVDPGQKWRAVAGQPKPIIHNQIDRERSPHLTGHSD